MKLTDEQIEKAAQAAYEALYSHNFEWQCAHESHKKDMRQAVQSAAPYLQYAPEPVSGDLVSRMEHAYSSTDDTSASQRGYMTVAALVCVNAAVDWLVQKGYSWAATKMRDALISPAPKTPEERVTIRERHGEGLMWEVLDGDAIQINGLTKESAEIYRLGLIAKLKEQPGRLEGK